MPFPVDIYSKIKIDGHQLQHSPGYHPAGLLELSDFIFIGQFASKPFPPKMPNSEKWSFPGETWCGKLPKNFDLCFYLQAKMEQFELWFFYGQWSIYCQEVIPIITMGSSAILSNFCFQQKSNYFLAPNICTKNNFLLLLFGISGCFMSFWGLPKFWSISPIPPKNVQAHLPAGCIYIQLLWWISKLMCMKLSKG